MRDKRPARRDPGDECQRLPDIEMRGMRSKTQGVDHQQLHPDQFPDLRVGDRLEIGQVGHAADAVARHLETLGVVPRHGHDSLARDFERPCDVDLVQPDVGCAAVLLLLEGIVVVLAHDTGRSRRRINVHGMNHRRVIHEIESAHVVDTARMILVLVRQQDRIETAYPRTQHLAAEIGAGIDHEARSAVGLDHRRGAQPLVAAIGRSADFAAASDHRHALGGSRTKNRQFHWNKDTICI